LRSREARAAGSFFARQPLVVAGVELLPLIYDESIYGSTAAIAPSRESR